MRGTLHVYTYKDGLLARLAHDLRLSLTRFEVGLADGRVTARFDPTSARVDGVASGEEVDGGALSERDKRSIEATIRDEILGTAPVTFAGAVSDRRVDGTLTMRGRSVGIGTPIVLGDELVVDTVIVPSRWGVAPYRALGGAIRLQDRWRVRLVLAWGGGVLGGTHSWEG